MWSKKWSNLLLLEKTGMVLILIFIYQNLSFLKNNSDSNTVGAVNELYLLFIVLTVLIVSFSIVQLLLYIKHKTKSSTTTANNVDEQTIVHESFTDDQKNINKKLIELKSKLMEDVAIAKKAELFISILAKNMEASQGAVFLTNKNNELRKLSFVAGYAYYLPESKPLEFEFGEGLTGQVAVDKKILNLTDAIEVTPIFSGLGKSTPTNLIICPIKNEDEVNGVFELASFKEFSKEDEVYIEKAAELLNEVLMKFDLKI